MAKKVTVTLIDDSDGEGAADETVEFGLDGVNYEIDLSSKNAAKLRAELKKWAEAGRRVLVLEARERVGGRGWTSTLPDTDLAVELGGAWFTEHQPLVRGEVERYGLGVREFTADSSTRSRLTA